MIKAIPKSIPPVIEGRLSDELYDALMAMARKNPGFSGATPWIHLADAVSRGTISPVEAYDALALGYLPMHLEARNSNYSHLL